MDDRAEAARVLAGIKVLHTAVWALFAGCIVAIPVLAALGNFRWAMILTGAVLVECAALAANKGRCPLTDLAVPYTEDRQDNFDIYLPLWLARYNKWIFGTLFVLGLVAVFVMWVQAGQM